MSESQLITKIVWVKWEEMPRFVRAYKECGVLFKVECLEDSKGWCKLRCICSTGTGAGSEIFCAGTKIFQ